MNWIHTLSHHSIDEQGVTDRIDKTQKSCVTTYNTVTLFSQARQGELH